MVRLLQLNNKFILASKSPRRIELLQLLLPDFGVEVSHLEELINPELSNEDLVMDLALLKANDISKSNKEAVVMGFDTLVILDGKPMGKPKDRDDAFNMLKSLSNYTHTVLTGCAIVHNGQIDMFYDSAQVTFNPMTNDEINEYLDTDEPYDKAGAYGIQGYGAKYIKKIDGDYYSVMGMPLQKLYNKLRRL